MSYFTSERPTTKVELTNPAYWVEIYSAITYKEQKALATLGENTNAQTADELLKAMIVSWNLDDESGNVVPITNENMDLLEGKDSEIIISAISGTLGTAEKKSSISKQ